MKRDAQLLEDAYACIANSLRGTPDRADTDRPQLKQNRRDRATTDTTTKQVPRRMLPTPIFHIDTNRINARGKLGAMNQLEKWKENGVILINMSGVSFKEAQAGSDSARTKKTFEQIFTTTDASIDKSDPRYKRIEMVLFPNGAKKPQEENDVKIVYEAAYWSAILVTNDGGSRRQRRGILGNRDALRDLVQIMTDIEAVDFIKTRIAKRDFCIRSAAASGDSLPDWIGKD